jgi:hypothetical protein
MHLENKTALDKAAKCGRICGKAAGKWEIGPSHCPPQSPIAWNVPMNGSLAALGRISVIIGRFPDSDIVAASLPRNSSQSIHPGAIENEA